MFQRIQPLLFRLDPERAHALTLNALRFSQSFPLALWILKKLYQTPPNPVQAFGLTFKNPIGLAAGYDKDALAVRGLAALGFGHVEVGTVTPLPQAGNPKPRVFRLLEDEAVINRMGFPSRGSEFVQNRLSPHLRENLMERFIGFEARYQKKRSTRMALGDLILGVNLGKNKSTPNESAVYDYLSLLQNFAPLADYLTINVSSPNTVGLRDLQGRAALEELLAHLHTQRKLEETKLEKRLPLLVKLAPDLTSSELDDALDVVLSTGMDGVIATNTTLAREGLRSGLRGESGGLSGSPLKGRSDAVLSQIVKRVDGRIPIVSAGGIMSPEDAQRRLDMGATLVQVYTGLIYRGPGLVKQIASGISSSAQASS
jgi:dihydroorotate dehydrogenase